jgi:hypothetical protein
MALAFFVSSLSSGKAGYFPFGVRQHGGFFCIRDTIIERSFRFAFGRVKLRIAVADLHKDIMLFSNMGGKVVRVLASTLAIRKRTSKLIILSAAKVKQFCSLESEHVKKWVHYVKNSL